MSGNTRKRHAAGKGWGKAEREYSTTRPVDNARCACIFPLMVSTVLIRDEEINMSMTRNEAIQHFGLRSRSKKTAAEHLATAPASVRAGLHAKDLEWIAKNPDVLAVEAAARLAVRSMGNPDGIIHKAPVAKPIAVIASPAAAAVRDYRVRAGLTQTQAGELCHRSLRAWQDAEAGLRELDPAAWELFLLRTGQHPTETLKTRQRAA